MRWGVRFDSGHIEKNRADVHWLTMLLMIWLQLHMHQLSMLVTINVLVTAKLVFMENLEIALCMVIHTLRVNMADPSVT